jgi:hypothetical protein
MPSSLNDNRADVLLLHKLHAIAAKTTASTQQRCDFFHITVSHSSSVNRAQSSSRAFEVDSSQRCFFPGQHERGGGHTGMNRNTRGGVRPSSHSFIKRSSSVQLFRIFDSFPAAVDGNVICSAVVVRLNHVIQVAALNTTRFLVFQLLVNEPIQVTAESRVSETENHEQNELAG